MKLLAVEITFASVDFTFSMSVSFSSASCLILKSTWRKKESSEAQLARFLRKREETMLASHRLCTCAGLNHAQLFFFVEFFFFFFFFFLFNGSLKGDRHLINGLA